MLSKPHKLFSHKKGKLLDWFKMAAYLLVAALALNAEQGFAQTTLLPNIKSNFQSNLTQSLVENGKVSADSLLELLSTWNNYPDAYKGGQDYIFYYLDSYFGAVPFRLYIPKNYSASKRTPLLVLLHGAVGLSTFERAKSDVEGKSVHSELDDDDLFIDYFKKQDYLILRPYGDPRKKFDWVVNHFASYSSTSSNPEINLTFQTIVKSIIQLKRGLNIDDNRIFAIGHSDGADGAFGFEIFQPSLFSGFVLYNSMLTNLQAVNIYLGNMKNFVTYIVHSDLDDLRPVQQTSAIIDLLKKDYKADVLYKVYSGYKHFDKHLNMDLPLANQYILKTVRNPFLPSLYWETNNIVDNLCAWIKVTGFDLNVRKKNWQQQVKINSYFKNTGTWNEVNYYDRVDPGCAIVANYSANKFTFETSKVISFEVLISGKMVDLKKPIKIFVNGRLVYNDTIKPDKKFIAATFNEKFDRDCIWENSIKVVVPNDLR